FSVFWHMAGSRNGRLPFSKPVRAYFFSCGRCFLRSIEKGRSFYRAFFVHCWFLRPWLQCNGFFAARPHPTAHGLNCNCCLRTSSWYFLPHRLFVRFRIGAIFCGS